MHAWQGSLLRFVAEADRAAAAAVALHGAHGGASAARRLDRVRPRVIAQGAARAPVGVLVEGVVKLGARGKPRADAGARRHGLRVLVLTCSAAGRAGQGAQRGRRHIAAHDDDAQCTERQDRTGADERGPMPLGDGEGRCVAAARRCARACHSRVALWRTQKHTRKETVQSSETIRRTRRFAPAVRCPLRPPATRARLTLPRSDLSRAVVLHDAGAEVERLPPGRGRRHHAGRVKLAGGEGVHTGHAALFGLDAVAIGAAAAAAANYLTRRAAAVAAHLHRVAPAVVARGAARAPLRSGRVRRAQLRPRGQTGADALARRARVAQHAEPENGGETGTAHITHRGSERRRTSTHVSGVVRC